MRLWRFGYPIERLGDRYRLEDSLGSGGMADVCLAWDEQRQRAVAIKVMKADELDQRLLDRFAKEATRVARWRHPNILRFYSPLQLELLDKEQSTIIPYIVMEYARGGDLQKRLRPGRACSLPEALHIFEQLCSAVAYAHSQGVIHRDLKPLNILFRRHADGTEEVVLSDFGLAVEIEATHHTFARGGTLHYMAPEQLRGRAGPASDIFALGVILYQLCTGRLPFRRTLQDLHRYLPPRAPGEYNPAIPPALDDVILRALAEDPTERYQDASTFWAAVQSTIPASTSAQSSTRHRSSTGTQQPRQGSSLDRQSLSAFPPQAIIPSISPEAVVYEQDAEQHSTGGLSGADIIAQDIVLPREKHIPARSRYTAASARNAARQQYPTPSISTPDAVSLPTPAYPATRKRLPRPLLYLLPILIVALAATTIFVSPLRTTLGIMLPGNSPFSTTPSGQQLTYTGTIQAITSGTPAAGQITAHQLSATSDPLTSNTVPTSGHNAIPATQAKGKLTFLNGKFAVQTIPAGSVIIASDGIKVTNDTDAVIPAANPDIGKASNISVPAHVIDPGIKGNINKLDVNRICCIADGSIFVENLTPFTGGRDAQDYNYVTQGDVDKAAGTVMTQAQDQASRALAGKVAAGEQLSSVTICTPRVSADHPVGDHGVHYATVATTVTTTCKGFSYSQQALRQMVATMLASKIQSGSGYTLDEKSITIKIIEEKFDSNTGVLGLSVSAGGRASYTVSTPVRH